MAVHSRHHADTHRRHRLPARRGLRPRAKLFAGMAVLAGSDACSAAASASAAVVVPTEFALTPQPIPSALKGLASAPEILRPQLFLAIPSISHDRSALAHAVVEANRVL